MIAIAGHAVEALHFYPERPLADTPAAYFAEAPDRDEARAGIAWPLYVDLVGRWLEGWAMSPVDQPSTDPPA